MKTKLFIPFILFVHSIFAQNCTNFKQLYDYTHSKIPLSGDPGSHNGAYNYMLAADPYSSYTFGESLGFLLESYIVMYKATKDKDYIFKSINESFRMMSWRLSNKKFSEEHFYKNGIICWGIAHLSYTILIDCPELKNVIIPSNILIIPNSSIPSNVIPSMTYSLENIANWLCLKTNEGLLEHINTNWVDNETAFKNDIDDNALAINMQSSFGAAMLYLGKIGSVNSTYTYLLPLLDYGATIARLYKQHISFEDKCECESYDDDLLIETSDNCYWWYHQGWSTRKKNCNFTGCIPFFHLNQIEKWHFIEFKEDISHALVTLSLPKAANDINLYTYNYYPFSNSVMVKFRNMFTKKIFNGNFNSPNFSNAVDGTQQPISPGGLPNNYFNSQSIAYMPFYKYDNFDETATEPNVYEIVLNYFQNFYNLSEISNGIKIYGLSEIVNAYYDKECYDLTIYNRKLTYNQNFFAKQNLEINPTNYNCYHAANDESFADPIITSNIFTIEPSVQSTISAGNSVSLKGEVHFKSGSEVEIKTIQNSCFTGGRFASNSNENYLNNNPENTTPMDIVFVKEKKISNDVTNNTIEEAKEDFISITSNTNSIVVKSISPIKDIVIFSTTGMLVQTFTNINETQKELIICNYSSGLYIIKAQNNSEIKTQKVNFLRN